MQKTEYLARLLHLFITGKRFFIITSLLILTVSQVSAGEKVVTLAMHKPVVKKTESLNGYSLLNTNNLVLNQKNGQPETVSPHQDKAAALTASVPIENQTNVVKGELCLSIHEDWHAHSKKPVTVDAGYCQMWDDKSMLQKISCGHQEAGCVYVSAKFSF